MEQIEKDVAALVQQRNKIDKELNDLNIEALKIQGQLELLVELENGKSESEIK
jgi:hypothetical protein